MSLFAPDFDETVVVRAADAELTGAGGPVTNQLLVDSPATGGALSTMRVTLGKGANGARPHHHGKSAEMFHVLDGTAQLLSGDQVVIAERGDVDLSLRLVWRDDQESLSGPRDVLYAAVAAVPSDAR